MLKRNWLFTLLGGILLVALSTVSVLTAFARQDLKPAVQQSFTYYSYAVKFVCGFQPLTPNTPGEPPVKSGNYATEINIHNYQYNVPSVPVRKKVVLLVKEVPIAVEPESAGPTGFDGIDLRPDFATMDDCNRLARLVGIAPSVPMPLLIGYLVLISPADLDVDAVYTAEVPGRPGTTPTGISIDVEHITGKQLTINTSPDKLDDYLREQH